MTLDLVDVSAQISAMAAGLQERRRGLWQTLAQAKRVFAAWGGAAALPELQRLAGQAGSDRLVAEPLEPLDTCRLAPPAPLSHTIIGTDGSQIDLDRHSLAPCYLINVGSAVLAYGEQPAASLSSRAALHYADEDAAMADGEVRVAVQGSILDLYRTLAEQRRARDLARDLKAGGQAGPLVVMIDGTLILWRFSGRAAEHAAPIAEAYRDGLRALQEEGVPVCSYVSRPSSRDVVNLLTLAACLNPPGAASARAGGATTERPADLGVLHDRLLFEELPRGARSGLYASRAAAPAEPDGEGRIHFFYLNVGSEVGRVEVPDWVTADPALLDLVHALVAEQCRLGWGYPIALSEAHEQAVIRGGEREAFLRMVSTALNDHGLAATLSLKRLSKNRRAV